MSALAADAERVKGGPLGRQAHELERDERRTSRPVVGCAVVGVGFIALQIYIYSAWLINGHARPVGTGADPVPGWMKVSLISQEVAFGLGALVVAYAVLYRPWKRDRRLGWDGMAFIAAVSLIWQDPLYSYMNIAHTYNSYFTNLGSWAADIPGWLPPNGQFIAQPVLWDAGVYILVFCGALIPANALMRRAVVRWPRMSNVRLVGLTYIVFVIFDIALESSWLRLGTFSYGGEYSNGWMIFRGHYYQFPLFEALALGAVFTGLACLRFFRDDRGQSIAERGAPQTRGGARRRAALRVLALIGVFNAIALGYAFVVPYMTIHTSGWAEDVQSRSYFMHGLCGPGTTYACPGGDVPVARKQGLHVGPDGALHGTP
jgi:hypothetical protein